MDAQPTQMEIIIQLLVALGTIGAVLVAIWGDWFRAKFAKPNLSIEFTDEVGTRIPVFDTNGQSSVAFYIHLKVVNRRTWTTPRNCRVLLRALSKRGPDGQFHTTHLTVPLQYVWAPSETTQMAVDIPHEQYFDFGMIVKDLSGTVHPFHPRLYVTSNNFKGIIKPGESVRYSLQIQGDGFAQAKYTEFEVAWDGAWSDTAEDMREHLRINRIENNG